MTAESPFDTWLTSEPFRDIWVPVAQSRSPLIGPAYINGMLAQAADPAELLKSHSAPSSGLGGAYGGPARTMQEPPDFLIGHPSRSGAAIFWPFAHVIEAPGGRREMEPLQQLLAHHAAWPEHVRGQKRWCRLNNGEEQMIVRWSPDPNESDAAGTLEVFRPALLKYLFDMNLHFAFFFDARADGSGFPDDWKGHGDTARRSWRGWNTGADQLLSDRPQAMMLGVEILLRPDQDPEAEADEDGVEFTVAIDPDTGNPITVSYPGEASESTVWEGVGRDNFLTPLYFKPTVLDRYHADPRLYSVEPGAVRAWAGWMLQVALTEQGNYQAYLGDVASLPRREQEHWVRHPVVGDEIPESRRRTDFYAEFVDGPSHRTVIEDLRDAVGRVNHVASSLCKRDLFPPVEAVNAPKVNGLRVPRNEVSSFQQQLTALSLLLGESLDNKCLTAAGAPKIEGAGTIKRLEALLEQLTGREAGGVREDIGVLFEIQALRSNVGGVHDTSGAENTLGRLNPSNLPWDDWFVDIVERTVKAVNFIEQTLSATPRRVEAAS